MKEIEKKYENPLSKAFKECFSKGLPKIPKELLGTTNKLLESTKELTELPNYNEMGEKKTFDESMESLGIQEKEDIISWKKRWSRYMMWAIAIQYSVLVLFIFLQGFKIVGFYLDEWIFYIFTSGTLVHSYLLIRIIFTHLFSVRGQNTKGK